MPRLKQKLQDLLKGAARVAVVGIGSDLRADDAAGVLVLEHMRKKMLKKKAFFSSMVGAEPLFGERQRSPHGDATPTRQKDIKKIVHSLAPALKLFNGGTAPENLTGEIRRFKPGLIIMLDSVDLGKKAGAVSLVDLKKTAAVFLTHKLPVKLMLDFLAAEMEFKTIFIGIQPKSLDFGAPVSTQVAHAARMLADLLAFAVSPYISRAKKRT
jgi:hydrogenase 3 maturation protease